MAPISDGIKEVSKERIRVPGATQRVAQRSAASQNRDPSGNAREKAWAPALQRTAPQELRAALRLGNEIVPEQRPRCLVSSMHPQPNKRVFPLRRARLFHETKEPAMGLFTKDIKTMNDLFVHQLQDIYYAEQQLTKALP